MRFAVGVLLVGLSSGVAIAQAKHCDMAMSPATAGMTTPAASLDKMLSLYEEELTGAVKAMPADKFDFKPSASAFAAGSSAKFDGVRSFAGQVQHLTQANYFFFSNVTSEKPGVDVKGIGDISSKDELVKALAASFQYAHKAIDAITSANAFVTVKGVDGMNTRVTIAAFAVAHGFDHYGQLVEYLRMNGVVPPASAK